jgi:hypothetical protein
MQKTKSLKSRPVLIRKDDQPRGKNIYIQCSRFGLRGIRKQGFGIPFFEKYF